MVVTGIGLVTPQGDRAAPVFERLYAGETAVGFRRYGSGSSTFEAPVAEPRWDPDAVPMPLARRLTDPVAHMAYAAASQALSQSGLSDTPQLLARAGIYMGCSLGGARSNEEGISEHLALVAGGRGRIRPANVARVMANAPAAHISMGFGIRGPAHTYSVACASSAAAVGEAFRAVRDGYLDCAVAGGSEAMLTAATLANWHALGVLAKPHPDGEGAAVRPFDRARTGFAVGEGAAILVLEAHEAARARGATPIGEIVGYGASSDAFDLTEPAAEGQAEAMRAALRDAGVDGAAVGYVNAHGTATSVGDRVEIRAMREVFGAHADRLAVSSTKSMHGHLVGAAGALELAITLLGLAEGRVPPTANLTDPDPECDLDCVPLRGREVPDLEYALSNSFAFGGANVALLVRRVPV